MTTPTQPASPSLREQLAHCDGRDCTCAAYGQCECACGCDWTPAEVYELRAKLAAIESLSPPVVDAAPAQQAVDDAKDAARWRFLRPNLVGADFAWNSPPIPVLIFEFHGRVSADADATIDAALASKGGDQ